MDDNVLKSLKLKWSKFIPDYITPTPKQIAFMMLPHREALFGGAAGSGKSIILSALALQYADVVGYNGVIFRRTLTEAALGGSILDILYDWLSPRMGKGGDVAYNDHYNTFTFLEYNSQLTIAYLKNEYDHERYKGTSFHSVFFDELTDFAENQYTFLNRSLRRNVHVASGVPLRVRAATNPGGQGHCIPYGDVLTPTGWKNIKDFQIGDSVYSVKPNGELYKDIVTQLHKYKSPRIVRTNMRGFHLSCTPEHKVAFVTKRKDGYSDFSLREFNKLPGQACILRTVKWKGKNPKFFKVEKTYKGRDRKLNQPTKLKWADYCELMGWYLSEGFTVPRDKAFGISQVKPQHRKTIKKLLSRCGFSYRENADNFTIYAADWFNYFITFGRSWDKFIPRQLLNSTSKNLQTLFNALMNGDGHWVGETSGEYYTTSKELSEDFLELAVKLGYIAENWYRDREPGGGAKTRRRSYETSFKTTKSGGTELLTGNHVYSVDTKTKRKSNIVESDFNRNTYCIGVQTNHSFVVKQQGYVWVSGNSWVKSRFKIRKSADGLWRGNDPDKPFIQATLKDNPHIDQSSYTIALNEMGQLDRLRMKEGDWDAAEGARFKEEWFNSRWQINGAYFHIPEIKKSWHRSTCDIFISLDPAASTREGTANIIFKSNGSPSYTVMSVWAKTNDNYLLWLDQVRIKAEIPDILRKLIEVSKSYKPNRIIVDSQGYGKGVAQMADFMGLPVVPVPTTSDKVQNAAVAMTRSERGKVILPREAAWLEILKGELFTWTGHPNETDDQIDAFSNAANYVQSCVTFGEREYDTQPIGLPTSRGEGWSNGYAGDSYPYNPFFSGEETQNPFGG